MTMTLPLHVLYALDRHKPAVMYPAKGFEAAMHERAERAAGRGHRKLSAQQSMDVAKSIVEWLRKNRGTVPQGRPFRTADISLPTELQGHRLLITRALRELHFHCLGSGLWCRASDVRRLTKLGLAACERLAPSAPVRRSATVAERTLESNCHTGFYG